MKTTIDSQIKNINSRYNDISDIQSYMKYWLYVVTKPITSAIPTDI